jgi:hypothetical protein
MTIDPKSNIIQLDSYRGVKNEGPKAPRIVRISSELDGMEALYCSDLTPDHLFSVKILFWALLDTGSVCAVIPWLEDVITTDDDQSIEGSWQGYYDATQDRIFFKPPEHKAKELELSHQFYHATQLTSSNRNAIDTSSKPKNELDKTQRASEPTPDTPGSTQQKPHQSRLEESPPPLVPSALQELPDHLGTHAAFKKSESKGFYLKPIISWRLSGNGSLLAMVPEEESPNIQPVIGSDELVCANASSEFRYYFQHGIAKRIKHQDPNAMTVVSLLIDLV